MTPDQEVEALSKVPLMWQPGSTWQYSLSVDLLGRILEKISGKTLGALLEEELLGPLGMRDTGFLLPKSKSDRIAQPLATDPSTGAEVRMLDPTEPQGNDSGGAGIATTADDYMKFCQMLLNGGSYKGHRYLSRTTVAFMTSDHLGPKVATPDQPGEVLMGSQGYTFGLGFMVRQGLGLANTPGSEGEYGWAGAAGTYFWVDPKERLIGILMAQTSSGAARHRRMIRQLTYQALE